MPLSLANFKSAADKSQSAPSPERRIFLSDFNGTAEIHIVPPGEQRSVAVPNTEYLKFLADKAKDGDLVLVGSKGTDVPEIREFLTKFTAANPDYPTDSFICLGKEDIKGLTDEAGAKVVFDCIFDNNEIDPVVLFTPKKRYVLINEDGSPDGTSFEQLRRDYPDHKGVSQTPGLQPGGPLPQ